MFVDCLATHCTHGCYFAANTEPGCAPAGGGSGGYAALLTFKNIKMKGKKELKIWEQLIAIQERVL